MSLAYSLLSDQSRPIRPVLRGSKVETELKYLPSSYRSAVMTVSLYTKMSGSVPSSADVCDMWSSCPTPFWEICPYSWGCPPPPGMMQWESSGVLASWLEPVVEGTPLTWPVLVEPLALLGERLFGGGRWCWMTRVGGTGAEKWAGKAA